MKIGFDAKRFYHNYSGLGQYSRYIVHQLARLYPSNEYFLIAAESARDYDGPLQDNYVPLQGPGFYRRSIDMRELWKQLELDVYHGLSNEIPQRISSNTKTVVTIHDMLYEDFPEDYSWIDRRIYRWKTGRSVKKADHIVTISHKVKRELKERYKIEDDRITVVYQSCREEFKKAPEADVIKTLREDLNLLRPYLICVSSFSHRKNQYTLIEAFYHSGLWKDIDLVLVGKENKYQKKLKGLVASLDIQQAVRFLSPRTDMDIVTLYHGAKAVIYPSRKEGFGIPVLEGMASGRPVIVKEDTSCQEIGGDAVLTFNGSIADLAEKMLEIINDTELAEELVEKGRERIKEFAPEKEIPKLMKVYEGLVG
ncbi:MAG: glycosyltransferase family 1 protein [Saprospiraceae bacterium]|nr:glycosyltransferase family 1 protein [Saprospiraceae bacterium]